MSAAHEVVARKSVLGVENIGVDLVEGISAPVVVAVAGGAGEHSLADVVGLERLEHLLLLVLLDLLELAEAVAAKLHRLICGGQYLFINIKKVFHSMIS